MDWFRWYNGTYADAKWRLVARRTGQPVANVVAVWAALGEHANEASERGTAEKWDSELIAAALDLDAAQVDAIVEAMQGRTLDGLKLKAFEKRNPKREDPTAADRQRRKREKDRTVTPDVTPRHAPSRSESVSHVAREERELEEEKETTQASKLQTRAGARSGLDEQVERQVDEIIRLANRGMSENPDLDEGEPIVPGHGSRQAVAEWLASGISAGLAARVVYRRAKEYKPGDRRKRITSMRYFDAAVRDEHEREQAKDTPAPADDEHNGNGNHAAARGGGSGRAPAQGRKPAAAGAGDSARRKRTDHYE